MGPRNIRQGVVRMTGPVVKIKLDLVLTYRPYINLSVSYLSFPLPFWCSPLVSGRGTLSLDLSSSLQTFSVTQNASLSNGQG